MELFDRFLKKIADKEPFSFSRFGDGEWASLLQMEDERRTNTDGHTYFKDMGEALVNVLKSKPNYYLGMQRFARDERYPEEIDSFLDKHSLKELNWVNADVFHHASIKGYFEQFFDVIEKLDCPVILVGPKYLEDLIWRFGFATHIQIPEKNCWLKRDDIMNEVNYHLANCSEELESAIVLFVASMPANYMIDELYKKYGADHTFIDCGSVFDPYCGQVKRGYHKKVVERLNNGKNIL